MPTCCEQDAFTFVLQSTTTIPYDAALLAKYGPRPRVTVMYYNEAGNLVAAGVFTRVELTGSPTTQIKVYHGGPATGLIKIY